MSNKERVDEFIKRGDEIRATAKPIARGSKLIPPTISPDEYEQWKSDLKLFSMRELKTHTFYNELQNSLNVDDRGGIDRFNVLVNVLAKLKSIAADDLFWESTPQDKTEAENRSDMIKNEIDEFINRAKDLEFQRNIRSKQSSMGFIIAIGGDDFEQWRSELLIFTNQYLSGHILYRELLEVLESYKTKTLLSLSDSIGTLKAIASDSEFFRQSTSTQSNMEEIITMAHSNDIFIVHGHDEGAKEEVARFTEKIGLTAIILNEQANSGKTLIEKFEKYSNVGFAIILYTPCDKGKAQNDPKYKSRARQNVVFEHGYFVAKLGRERVCTLKKHDVEWPSDLSGIAYIPMDNQWKYKVIDELKAAGYSVSKDSI